jgi:hypothetical protein
MNASLVINLSETLETFFSAFAFAFAFTDQLLLLRAAHHLHRHSTCCTPPAYSCAGELLLATALRSLDRLARSFPS